MVIKVSASMAKMTAGVLLALQACQVILSAHVHSHSPERTEDAFNSLHYDSDGYHNSEYDHQAILGNKEKAHEFDELSPDEAKKRLRVLVTKGGMDADGDGFVEQNELTEWVMKSFQSLADEEGAERFSEEDSDSDGFISWEEHMKANFDSDFEDVEEMIHEDKTLYKAADLDGDGLLNVKEFPAFNSPEDYQHMHETLYELAMERKDLNKDGLLDFNEFIRDDIGGTPDVQSETYLVEKEHFEKDYDLDKNGYLDKKEVLIWLIPDNRETAESEAIHLVTTCDDDGDGKLSVDEIVAHHDVFVGSEATDFAFDCLLTQRQGHNSAEPGFHCCEEWWLRIMTSYGGQECFSVMEAIEPVYPVYVDYYVSHEIWQMFEIYIWHLIMARIGKNRTFKYMQHRYEKVPKNGPAIKLLVTVFLVSYIILVIDDWIKIVRRGETNYPNLINIAKQLLIPMPREYQNRRIEIAGLGDPGVQDED